MDLQGKIIQFVADFTGVEGAKITPYTLVNDELGVDGDDGIEFLIKFAEEFDVDLALLMNEPYFGREGFSLGILVWPLLLLLNYLGWEQKIFRSYSPLPVQALIEFAKNGKIRV